MISKQESKKIVERYLLDAEAAIGCPFVIFDEYTQEFDFGWVYFYNSKEALETNGSSGLLAGNGPLIVDRNDGAVHALGTAMPSEYYINEFKSKWTPSQE